MASLNTQSSVEVCRQLERMLQSREFVTQPRIAKLLRFFVEESVRTKFKPINQRLIATHALGLEEGFSPSQSANVRVNVARLRRAVEKYNARYDGVDPVVLEITPGPYQVIVKESARAADGQSPQSAIEARRKRPLLLVVETGLDGKPGVPDGLARTVSVRVASQLAESTLVIVSGPLLRDRIADQELPLVELADTLGYEFTAESEIGFTGGEWNVRLVITDACLGETAIDAAKTLGRIPETAAAVEAIANWLCHSIGDYFATRVSPRPSA